MPRLVRRARRIVASLLVLTACADDGLDRTTPFVAPTPEHSVVTVRATGCRRTSTRSAGVVVAPGLIVTVAHSVAGEDDVSIVLPDRSTLDARVAAIDTRADLAVLRVPGLRVASAPLGASSDGPASFVSAPEGAPTGEAVDIVRSVTVRTSDIYREGTYERPGLELADASVDPGDSGGGLFQGGRLVGIVWAASRRTEGRAWATEVDAYADLIRIASTGAVAKAVSCGR